MERMTAGLAALALACGASPVAWAATPEMVDAKPRPPLNPTVDVLGPVGVLPEPEWAEADILDSAAAIDQEAARLAREVLAGTGEALPFLLAAVSLSGVHVREGSRTLLAPAGDGPGQGIAFQAYEVQAMARLTRAGLSSGLDDIAGWISAASGVPAPDCRALLLEEIRQRAEEPKGPLRFFGRFVAELGRQSRTHPADLLAKGGAPAGVTLDATQSAFVLLRFAADLRVKAQPPARAAAPGYDRIAEPAAWSAAPRPRVLRAGYAPASRASLERLAPAAAGAGSSCEGNTIDGVIADLQAAAAGVLHGSLLDQFVDQLDKIAAGLGARANAAGRASGWLGSAGNALNVANVALAYVQLAVAWATFDLKFELIGPPPLVRTRTSAKEGGERKTLQITAKMDTEKSDWINCVRSVLNGLGLDFNVEKAGPLKDAEVAWGFLAGEDIVRFAGGNPTKGKTDEAGKARIGVEGVPQKTNLPQWAKKVRREAVVYAKVSIKNSSDGKQNLVDALAAAAGGLGGLATIPVEIAYRTGLGFERNHRFEVTDWTDKLTFKFESTLSERSTCGGGEIKIDGGLTATFQLAPVDEERTVYLGEARLEPAGTWSYKDSQYNCTIKPEAPTIMAYRDDDGRLWVHVDMSTDRWQCNPGARGKSWWWLKFTMLHQQDRGVDKEQRVWFEMTPDPAGGPDGTMRRTWAVSTVTGGCEMKSERTTVELKLGE